jgi:nucleolar complex protein 3
LEVQASANEKQLGHNQTQILEQIFALYFRVLKQAQDSPLLAACLEGLGKFAHLIDTNFYDDLFVVRHRVVVGRVLACPPALAFA